MSAQQAFSVDFPLMWEWEECNSFDVASGSTQICPPIMSYSLFGENTVHVVCTNLMIACWSVFFIVQKLATPIISIKYLWSFLVRYIMSDESMLCWLAWFWAAQS